MKPNRALQAITITLLTLGILPINRVSAVSYPTDSVPSTRAPWVAALFIGASGTGAENFARSCTGSLIDSRHVLTAAHCVFGRYASDITVALGGTNLNESGLYQVADYETHSRYTHATSSREVGLPHDIALIRLTEPVIGITPVNLSPESDIQMRTSKTGMDLYGWGEDQNGNVSEYLGFTKQRDFSAKAKRWFRDFNGKTQIAAGLQRDREKLFSGACYGDSGGPLVGYDTKRRPHVLGVVSYGATDCKAAAPTVYSRVSSYRQWIGSARSKMVERAPRTAVEYAVADVRGDGLGVHGRDADIVSAYVSSTPAELSLKVYLPASYLPRIPIVKLEPHESGEFFALLSPLNLSDASQRPVCAVTEEEGYDNGGYYTLISTSAACLYRAFGRTSFDMTVAVYAFGYGVESHSGEDAIYVDFVSLYMP